MTHPEVIEISKKLGLPIVERDSWETWMFDGRTLANHRCVTDCFDENGQITTPFSTRIYYEYTALLHELGHFLAAASDQRDLPEFGLMMGRESGYGYGPYGGEFRNLDGTLRYSPGNLIFRTMGGLVDSPEDHIQEKIAQLLTIYWAGKYNIPCIHSEWPAMDSWDKYFEYKFKHSNGGSLKESDVVLNWEALIRFSQLKKD